MNEIENKLYAIVAEEIETKQIDKGLWTKSFADADGDENKTKAMYIKLRVKELHRQILEESKKRDKEEKLKAEKESKDKWMRENKAELEKAEEEKRKFREERDRQDAKLKE